MCPLLKAYCALIPSVRCDGRSVPSFSDSIDRQNELVRAVNEEVGIESLSPLRDPRGSAKTQQRVWESSNFFMRVAFVSGDIWQIIRSKERSRPIMTASGDMLNPEYLELWVRKIDQSINEAVVAHVTFKLDTKEEQRGPRQLADAQREK